MLRESTELERRLIERTRREGAITFRDFMQCALYDPDLGYYNTERPKIGAQGDYYTSSNVHPAFGSLLARAFAELHAGSGEPLTIVEMGAGTGQLACDVLSAFRDEHGAIFEHLAYVLVESSPAMRARQQAKLTAFKGNVRWRDLEELERAPVSGIVFSNELIDALPVHRVRRVHGVLEELYMAPGPNTDEPHLALVWCKPSTQELIQYVERLGLTLREGQILEINLDMIDWLRRIARVLRHGFLITIDYGDTAQHLHGQDRDSGTLRSFYRHRLIDSPLERIGEQDITASVDFSALIEHGRDFGFETVSYERQSAFLIRMGLIERIVDGGSSSSPEHWRDNLALKNLFVPGGVSENFRVLIQKKSQPAAL